MTYIAAYDPLGIAFFNQWKAQPRVLQTDMNLNSKYFDMIRLSRRHEAVADTTRRCDWPDCDETAAHPAPAGRDSDERRYFCFAHAKQYNQSYNFFEGMSDADVENFQRAASTGHRPTWALGARRARGAQQSDWQFDDPLEIMRHAGPINGEARQHKRVSSGQEKALGVMGLDANASAEDVRKRYKNLVKKYHPDANQGDRKFEAELQKVIKAHDYLKASGFC